MSRMVWMLQVVVLLLAMGPNATKADSFVFVSLLQERKIVTFQRSVDSGELRQTQITECSAEPAYLTASKDGRVLFVSYRSTGQLAAFHIDASTGALQLINVVEAGEDPAFLIPDRTGRFLLTAYYVSNKVTVHGVHADGRLSEKPVCSLPTATNAHGVSIDSKNQSVYVSHTGANRIDQFRFDQETGILTALDPPFVTANAIQNPRHIMIHPSDRWAYCSNEAGGSNEDGASLYARDSKTMQLKQEQSVLSLPETFDANQNSTAECLLTPDGQLLYVANRGHNSIAGFSVDQSNGRLKRVSITPTEAVPRSFTISPDGRHLYVAGETSGRVASYAIKASGELKLLDIVESGPISWAIVAMDIND
ncbi:MAG: beta-propeller fold lactonase family protein [Planctomycetaceae bacterium]